MSELRIRIEYLPIRCDVCHQADRFNPVDNHCSRCATVRTGSSVETHGPILVDPGIELSPGKVMRFILVLFIYACWGVAVGSSFGAMMNFKFRSEPASVFCIILGLLAGLYRGI